MGMSDAQNGTGMQEDWELQVSFLPTNGVELAAATGALQRLRKNKSAASPLRVLLLHLGCGHSTGKSQNRRILATEWFNGTASAPPSDSGRSSFCSP